MSKKYLFQKREVYFTQKLFERGLNSAACILFAIKEGAEGFLANLPNSYPAFKFWKDVFGVGGYKKPVLKKVTLRSSVRRLIKDGLVVKDLKRKKYSLTLKGKELVDFIEKHYHVLSKPWDGKFRVIVFDIPEEQKSWRQAIRGELRLLQFQPLQKSVYIGQYPVPKSFIREIEKAKIGHCVFIFTIDKIDRGGDILKLFEDDIITVSRG